MKPLVIVQVVVAFLLVFSILFQSPSSSGMSASGAGGSYYARRGFERFLLWATILLTILFITLAGINAWLANRL